MTRTLMAVALASMCWGCTSVPTPAPDVSPVAWTGRNIVFILVDDQRFDTMSLLGHPFLETPNLDALAETRVLFEKAFVTTSLCSPSRASFLTGQYAHVHRVLDNSTRLDPDVPIFPPAPRHDGSYDGRQYMYPDERNNLLGAFLQRNEAGTLDALIRRTANPDLRALYDDMDGRLTSLAGEVGVALEPNWTRLP